MTSIILLLIRGDDIVMRRASDGLIDDGTGDPVTCYRTCDDIAVEIASDDASRKLTNEKPKKY